jgi:hypothetical protein
MPVLMLYGTIGIVSVNIVVENLEAAFRNIG